MSGFHLLKDMETPYYPELSDQGLLPLKVLQAQMAQFPRYLQGADCPYSPDMKATIKALFTPLPAVGTAAAHKSLFLGRDAEKWAAMESECAELYEELKTFGAGLSSTSTSEKMAFFKTSTALLEKIVSINERAMGLRQLSDFQRVVLEIMDNELTPGQRTEIMNRLKVSIGQEAKPIETPDEV